MGDPEAQGGSVGLPVIRKGRRPGWMIGMILSSVVIGQTPAAARDKPRVEDVYRLRVSGGFYGGDYQSIALRRIVAEGGAFWMVEQRKRLTAGVDGPTIKIERRWVDGRNCPALAPLMETITRIPQPGPSWGPRITIPTPTIPTPHGNTTYLGVLKPNGAYAVRSDYEGPITDWWRTTEQKLADCWGHARRMVDGVELPLTLETDADEAPYIALEAKP